MIEYISHAAIKRSDDIVVKGKDHAECIRKSPLGTCKSRSAQGFLTNTGRFVERVEAGKIAWEAGQIHNDPNGDIIISEEIWFYGNYSYDAEKGYYLK